MSIRALSSNTIQTYSWRQDLYCHGSESDLMIDTFTEILHKINSNHQLKDLKFSLRQKNTLIAYSVDYNCIVEKIILTHHDHPLKAIYFNKCIISVEGYKSLFNSATVASLKNLHIYNCYIGIDSLTMLFTELSCKEIFIHTLCDIDTNSLADLISRQRNCSTLLLVKNMLLGYKPTIKQIAVALQLNPSNNALKLMNYKGTFDSINLIMEMVLGTSINWTELDLADCSIGEIEYGILCRYFKNIKKTRKYFPTVSVLKISTDKLTMSVLPTLMEISLIWMVQELVFCGNRCHISQHFISRFKNFCINDCKASEEIFLSVTCNSNKIIFICNLSSMLQISSIRKLVKLWINHISQIYIINTIFSLHENDTLIFLETLVNRRVELSILHTKMAISNDALYNFITKKEKFYQSKIRFVAITENFRCGYNATKDQLHLLQSQRLHDLEYAVVTLAQQSHTKHIHKSLISV